MSEKFNAQLLEREAGIVRFDEGPRYFEIPSNYREMALALDAAQPGMVSQSNAGIPAFLRNYLDPAIVDVLLAPKKAVEICGEAKRGDWTLLSTQIPLREIAGEASAYGDFSNNGTVSSNIEWEARQCFHFQTITQWGEQELAVMGLGKVDYASALNISSAEVLSRLQNKTYFFGVSGLQCYGLLNDPSLTAALTPGTKTGGGTAWSAAALGSECYADVFANFQNLVTQANGLVDRETKMILGLSPAGDAALTKVMGGTVWGVTTVGELIKKNFPNLTIKTAPEYATSSGGLMQLIVPEYEGVATVKCEFTEKMRAFGIIKDLSSYKQKKMAGTWGTIIKRPMFISQTLGI